MDSTLFSMKQVLNKINTSYEYSSMNIVLFQEEAWTEVDTKTSSILEVLLPQDTVVIKRPVREGDRTQPIGRLQSKHDERYSIAYERSYAKVGSACSFQVIRSRTTDYQNV